MEKVENVYKTCPLVDQVGVLRWGSGREVGEAGLCMVMGFARGRRWGPYREWVACNCN